MGSREEKRKGRMGMRDNEEQKARQREKRKRGWVLSVIALWLPVKLQNLLNTLVEAASGMFSALLLHGRHLAWCWGVKREEMVQQEFSSSVWIICSVCLAGKWPGESASVLISVLGPLAIPPAPVPHSWVGEATTCAPTLFLGQPGPAAGSCFHQADIRGNLLQPHLIPGVFLFLHPYLLMSL